LKQGFNFLKPQVEPPSVWTRVYDWVVGTARLILIIFEVAVVIALGIRIVVDIQSKNLDDQIGNVESILNVRSAEEIKYRLLQDKINAFTTAWTTSNSYSSEYAAINKFIPLSATDYTVSIDGMAITITGKANNADIGAMENSLKGASLFTDTKLSTLEVGSGLSKFTFVSTIKDVPLKDLATPTPAPTDTPVPTPTEDVPANN